MRKIGHFPLWIGHAGNGRDVSRMHELGIRALVQLASEEPAIPVPRDLLYFRIPIADGSGDQDETLALAIRAVADLIARRVPTLVCCAAGLSRSPCVAAAGLAVAIGVSADEGLRQVADAGRCDVAPELWNEAVGLLAGWRSGDGA